ncbi:MAG: glycosyltransferase [Phycisphaerales bacterium]|nr:glycosyltransferase [Phycisphaerales bacterium]
MSLVMDVVYFLAAIVTAPLWLIVRPLRGKPRIDLRARLGQVDPLPPPRRPRLLFHAVSVGEVNAIRGLVARLAPQFEIVIATTTDTGLARARALFAAEHAVVRYPLDFSRAVRRFLDATRPDLVALVELEVWPNFTRLCEQRGIPVAVINGRLSDRSFPRYRRIGPLVRPSFRRLSLVVAQDEAIAERFIAVGARPERVRVVGTMKWDNALQGQEGLHEAAGRLAELFGLDRKRPIVVAGSTGPGEEGLIDAAVPDDVQLIVAPRKPEHFDEAARVLAPCVRRSQDNKRDRYVFRFLLDSIGELRAAYALADLIIVGRTFSNQRGSDMMEPIALGKPVIVGPDVRNFESVARALLDGGGMIQTTAAQLPHVVRELLGSPQRRAEVAAAGLEVIRSKQGCVPEHARLLTDLMHARTTGVKAGSHAEPRSAQS